ncbi:sensor domain-containing diguanylate cyclase [Vibrio cholerae]|nr:sensor domain-containing diguanylate cyclase [Vibrio cholerae]
MNSRKRNDSFLELFLTVPIPLCLVSDSGAILKINNRFIDVFGYDLQDIPTLKEWWVLAYPEPSYRELVLASWEEAVKSTEQECRDITPKEYFVCCKNGDIVEMEISGAKLNNGFLATFIDVTKRNSVQREFNRMAMVDNLTNLPNRRYISSLLDQFLLKLKQDHAFAAYMVIDLDNFKQINDIYGHYAGDILLIEVAKRIQEAIKRSDIVARFGGDEFIILLDSFGPLQSIAISESLRIAENVLKLLAQKYRLIVLDGIIEHECSASIGIRLITPDDENMHLVFEHADKAMYQAKKSGKNKLYLYPYNLPLLMDD